MQSFGVVLSSCHIRGAYVWNPPCDWEMFTAVSTMVRFFLWFFRVFRFFFGFFIFFSGSSLFFELVVSLSHSFERSKLVHRKWVHLGQRRQLKHKKKSRIYHNLEEMCTKYQNQPCVNLLFFKFESLNCVLPHVSPIKHVQTTLAISNPTHFLKGTSYPIIMEENPRFNKHISLAII